MCDISVIQSFQRSLYAHIKQIYTNETVWQSLLSYTGMTLLQSIPQDLQQSSDDDNHYFQAYPVESIN